MEYEEAIRAGDWPLVMHFAQTTACSIDHECEDGTTPLIRACEEQVEAVDYVYRRNEDGKLCMGVEYLLDRGDYRPALDIENRHGQTPLIRACILNRRHALKALIDRQASVHYRNREGRTALHFAVMVGSADCVLQLLDAGADPTVEDHAGVSCYAQAEENQFEHILNIMGAYKNGYTGDAKVVRGEDVPVHFMSCPFGCGAAIPPMEFKDHEDVCAFRIVPCPSGCADKTIFLAMLPHHLAHLCAHRVVPCEFCKERYPLHTRAAHDGDDCAYRLVSCPYKCGELVRYLDVEKHFQYSCSQRPVACPQSCMLFVKACDVDAHCKTFCVNRRVPCENGCGKLVIYKVMKNHVWDVCGLRKVSVHRPHPGHTQMHTHARMSSRMPPYNVQHNLSHRQVKCEFCAEMVPFPSMKEHLRACPQRYVLCPARCGEMVLIPHIPAHQKTTCGHRVVPCPLRCGSRVRQVDRKAHLQTVCGLRIVKCPYGCLIRENPATNAGVASDNVNVVTSASGDSGSGGGGEALDMSAALSEAQALLAAGANMTMFPAVTVVPWSEDDEREAKLRQMAAMATEDGESSGGPGTGPGPMGASGKETKKGKDEKMKALLSAASAKASGGQAAADGAGAAPEESPEEAAEHELQAMLAEQLRLEAAEGREDAQDARVWDRVFRFRAAFFDVHTKHECPNRPVACGLCGDRIMAKDRPHHKAERCLRRDVTCRLDGCAKIMPYTDLEDHERVHCRFRKVPCANGCPALVPVIRMGKHVAKDCPERFLACPLKCGVVMRLAQLDAHVEEDCPRRAMGQEKKAMKKKVYTD